MARSEIGLRSSRGPILLAIMVATAVVAIDVSILAAAVPVIVEEIGGFSQFPWLFSVYLLTQAVTVPVYSKLADTLGRKRILLFGLAVFLVGSVLCVFAWDMSSLIAFRAVKGVGAGAIMPITITIIGDIYSLRERAVIQGYTASVWGAAAVAGPAIGGIFAEWGIWRGALVVPVPLCVLALWLIVRNYHENLVEQRHRIDYAGAALLMASLSLLLLGVLEGGRAWEWASPASFAVFGGGLVLLIAFVLVERRAHEPVLPGWVVGRPLLLTTNAVSFAVGASLIGLTAFVPTYLIVGAGTSPLVAGLALATLTVGWPIASVLAGKLYLRIGFRSTSILGATIVLVASVALAALGHAPSVPMIAILSFAMGVGYGFAAMPTLVAAQSSVNWDERAVVTGANMFTRSMGQAIGAAIFGAVANGVIAAEGGDETDPATIVLATTAVFIGVAIISLPLLAGALSMPRPPRELRGTAAEPPPVPTSG